MKICGAVTANRESLNVAVRRRSMFKRDKSMMKLSAVYQIVCRENGYVYIGQTKNLYRRIGEHSISLRKGYHRNRALQSDFDKYGGDSFDIEILCTGVSDMDDIERAYISAATENGTCYNVFSGGVSGYSVPQYIKDAVSNRHKGKKYDEYRIRRLSNSAREQWKNQEYRDKMSSSAKRQWDDPDYRRMMIELHTGGQDACGHKLTANDVIEMRKLRSDGMCVKDIASAYSISEPAAYSAIRGETWKNI